MKYYIACAIDCPNNVPHIGTAYEKICADVQAVYQRMNNKKVYFQLGNDENTSKLCQLGTDPEAHVQYMAEKFVQSWEFLDISYDHFMRTTDPTHLDGVNEFINTVCSAGYIYKKNWQGQYCTGCKEYKAPSSLKNGHCPNHSHLKLEEVKEENYFFALSKFKDRLLDFYENQRMTVEPKTRFNEILQFIESGLEDVAISRKNKGWGIPIPWDETQVIYVWFDALLNYLTGVGFGTNHDKFETFWPADDILVGKDISRFHCILFPAMIMAFNDAFLDGEHLDFPKRIFVHGFINSGGEKIAKSGNAVSIEHIINSYDTDSFRYYFLSQCSCRKDGTYTPERFREVYNSDLANKLGNLITRTQSMLWNIEKFDREPTSDQFIKGGWDDFFLDEYCQHIENFNYPDALKMIWKLIDSGNAYIEQNRPWESAKNDKEQFEIVMQNLLALLRIVSILLYPFISNSSCNIFLSMFSYKNMENIMKISFLRELVKNPFEEFNPLIKKKRILFPRH